MIGVVPCQGDINNGLQNNSHVLDHKSSTGRLDNSNIANISSSLGNTTNKSIRPLTQAYKAAQSEHEVSNNYWCLSAMVHCYNKTWNYFDVSNVAITWN